MLKKSVSVRLEKVTKTFVDPHSKKDVHAVREDMHGPRGQRIARLRQHHAQAARALHLPHQLLVLAAVDPLAQQHRAAMGLQFDHVFAGEAVWSRERQH